MTAAPAAAQTNSPIPYPFRMPRASRAASSGARRRRPIRSKVRPVKTAAARRSGIPSVTRRARSTTTAPATAPTIIFTPLQGRRRPDQGFGREGLSVLDRMAAGISGGHRDGEPERPRFLRPSAGRTAHQRHRNRSRRFIIGICRRHCRTASADGNPQTHPRHLPITRAMSPTA